MKITLIPKDCLSLNVKVSKQSALNLIDKNTHASSLGNSFNPLLKVFSGSIDSNGFKIRRSEERLNSFSPIIIGTVVSDGEEQSHIHINMRLHYFVMLFMGVWLLGALALTFNMINSDISPINAFITFNIGYILMMYSFFKEAKLAKSEINMIFNTL